jgi:prevent-host-death family protein
LKQRIVGMHEAKTNLSKLVKQAEAGQEIVIANAGKPVAKIVGYRSTQADRKPGSLAGKIVIKPGFEDVPDGFGEAFGA